MAAGTLDVAVGDGVAGRQLGAVVFRMADGERAVRGRGTDLHFLVPCFHRSREAPMDTGVFPADIARLSGVRGHVEEGPLVVQAEALGSDAGAVPPPGEDQPVGDFRRPAQQEGAETDTVQGAVLRDLDIG